MDRIIYYQNIASKTKKICNTALSVSLLICTLSVYADTPQAKAVWYRYYDKNGVANISTSVTPAHIKNGYEALDRNMQVIKRNHAYNVEKDLQQSTSRASEMRKLEQDARLKRAYGNSSVAVNKRNELLSNIKQQITLQNQTLKQLQSDRIILKRQEMEYYRKGNSVPVTLKDRIKYNSENIDKTKDYIGSLQDNYRKTQTYYDDIINRLKKLE
ncbi:hypothetical protein M2R48_17105 [Acinetobacter sp. I-MWF]|uniref:hypothetical protein n=1 Tax=Acinetobacter sp. I-MWF TaxID=2940517 RepID=UPI0021C772A2|nr:hypothetical protein [Acinetobacter sp. I-MWF]MCT9980049.1 hypothetical protein [Acinetobacter sp. I-MWF]